MDKRIGLVFGMNPFHISTHSVRKLGYIKNKRTSLWMTMTFNPRLTCGHDRIHIHAKIEGKGQSVQ